MPFRVSYDEDDGIVYVSFSGAVTKEDHYAARDEALRLCGEHRICRLLVDLRDLPSHSFSTMESFSFAQSVARTPPHVRLAHVLPRHPQARENVRFASTVEANRGRPTGEFETIEEAKAWLLSSD